MIGKLLNQIFFF